jgi:hypothetical protein
MAIRPRFMLAATFYPRITLHYIEASCRAACREVCPLRSPRGLWGISACFYLVPAHLRGAGYGYQLSS